MKSQKNTPMTDKEREELATKLDQDLDDFINGLEKRSYTEGWPEDRWQEEMEKHPFFMTKAPNPKDELSPLMEGIQQLKYDSTENTPEELAATYKEDGNFNFKCKKYRFAILSFTEGIKLKCSDDSLNAQLYNNRAAANYFLKNYRYLSERGTARHHLDNYLAEFMWQMTAGNNRFMQRFCDIVQFWVVAQDKDKPTSLADCQIALKLQPQYNKALVRAAQCCFHLGRFQSCLKYCDQVLELNPSHPEIVKLRTDSILKQKMAERDQRKEAILERKARMDEENLLKAMQDRNIRVLGSDNSVSSLKEIEPNFPEAVQKPVHLVNGRLVWPVIFLYPEFQTSDFVQEFHEDTKFSDQLTEMFAEPPEWDSDRTYTPDNIHVYFEDPDGYAHMVNTDDSLGQIISNKRYRVDSGTPSFIILAKGTKAEERFLQLQ